MSNTNLNDILNRAPTEIERPKPLPQGNYVTVIVGMPRYDKSSKRQTDLVEFQHKFASYDEEVDAEALAEALTNKTTGEIKSLSDVVMKNTFYITEGAAWRLKLFLKDCGFNVESDEMSMREMIEQTTGRSVGVVIKHSPTQDGQGVFAQIGGTFAVE